MPVAFSRSEDGATFSENTTTADSRPASLDFRSQPFPTSALRASRPPSLSRFPPSAPFMLHTPQLPSPSRFPCQKTPTGGPIAKKMSPFGRKRRQGAFFDRKCRGHSAIPERCFRIKKEKPQVNESFTVNYPKAPKIRASQRGPLAAFSAK